jgi:nicotinate dehydrogenase subunit B
MNESRDAVVDLDLDIEPERYEFFENRDYGFELDRRGFLKALGGGILVLHLLNTAHAEQQPGGGRRRGGGGGQAPRDIAAWLHIGEDGQISVYTGKAEVGQNIRTSLAQVVAEELHAAPQSIRMVMADTQLTPFDMGTFGSRTTPDMSQRLRRTAAAAREMLIDLAAETWKADRGLLKAASGGIVHSGTGERLEFGRLTKGQKLTKAVSDQTAPIPPASWTVAGASQPKVDGRSFVTGGHQYASDIKLPGMLFGKILRPPSLGATLSSVDLSGAKSLLGVIVVHDGEFVGVAAPNSLVASRALAAIKAQWNPGPRLSGKDLYNDLKSQGQRSLGIGARNGNGSGNATAGSVVKGGELAGIHLEQTYTIAYIAHAPLEPRAAVARWEDGKLTVWTGSQRPFGVRDELSRAFGLSAEAVRVIVPDTGAGYGGKHTGEAAVEAARLARGAGKPVRLVWTREEEFTWAYFRPAGVIEVKSSARRDGVLSAWEFHNYNSGSAAIRSPYDVPGQRSEFHAVKFPLRQGSYRALAATANHFARESHMDELAHAAAIDPLEFRLKNLKEPRLRAVLEAAAEAFDWGKKSEPGHGSGIAVGTDKGGYIATCAEVAVDPSNGRVQVIRATSAFECGAIVNPDHLKNQVEGAMVMGLGGALFEAIEFEDSRITNARFSRYRVPRFRDTPAIEVVLLNRKDLPSAGAGESPIVAIAPAIGNAIFHATGIRLRSLPLAPRGVTG